MGRKFALLSLVHLSILFMACGDSGGSASQGTSFTTIENGYFSGIELTEPLAYKIDNQTGWVEFWSLHRQNTEPAPPPPVFFEVDMVIAVVDESRSSGGYALEITEINEQGGMLDVHVTRTEPGPGCSTIAVVTHPYHFVRLRKSPLPLRLVLSTVIRDCP